MNPYPERFTELLSEADGPVLDCGAGGRKVPGVIALEIEPHPNNDVQASGRALPFADESFVLVLSQAVLEHIFEPAAYIAEIVRVLKPGGLLYIEAAFMQPAHQSPMHAQNFTPFGLAYQCRALEILEQGSFGGLLETWDWIGREVDAEATLGSAEWERCRGSIRRLDEVATPLQVWNTSSAVSLLGRKP